MKTRVITTFILVAMLLCMLCACGEKEGSAFISGEEAQQIAMEAAGVSADEVTDVHAHAGTYQDAPCFSIHLTVGDVEYEYIIDAATGEILGAA